MGLDKNLTKKGIGIKNKIKKKNRWIRKLTDCPKKILTPFDVKLARFNCPESQKMINDNFGKNITKNIKTKFKNFGFIKFSRIVGHKKIIDEKTGEEKIKHVKNVEYVYKPSKDITKEVDIVKYVKGRNMYQDSTGRVFAYGMLKKIRSTVDNLYLLKETYPKTRRMVSENDITLAFDPNFDVTKANPCINENAEPKKKSHHNISTTEPSFLCIDGVRYCLPMPNCNVKKKKRVTKKKKKRVTKKKKMV